MKDLEAAWVKDVPTKDVDKFASYYSDDASLLLPNAPIINGRENITAALKPMLADPNFALTFQSARAEASKGGDFVYTVGTYSMTLRARATRRRSPTRAKYLTVFKSSRTGAGRPRRT